MREQSTLPVILFLLSWALLSSLSNHPLESDFHNWAKQNGKSYSQSEYTYRFGIYRTTVEQVQKHNQRYQQGTQSYFTAVNMFADLTDEEFSARYLDHDMPVSPQAYKCTGNQPPSKDLPEEFDWAAKSAVTSVRSQGGSCTAGYAMATVDAIESARYITTSLLKPLSAQQIIDCSKSQGNSGCKGGNILNSFEYIRRGGVASEASYPYHGSDQACSYNIGKKEWEILGCVAVTPKSEVSIRAAVYHQPVITSINSSKLKTYSGGVFESGVLSSCKTDPDTWMVIVGYGKKDKKNYWKLKNSLGSKWGEQGYLYIVRKGDGQGECGVQNELYFPID